MFRERTGWTPNSLSQAARQGRPRPTTTCLQQWALSRRMMTGWTGFGKGKREDGGRKTGGRKREGGCDRWEEWDGMDAMERVGEGGYRGLAWTGWRVTRQGA